MIFTRLVQISAAAFLFVAIQACQPCINGEGPIEQTSMDVDSFSVIVLKSPADLYVSQNHYPRTVTIKAQQNVIDMLDVNIMDATLTIDNELCYHADEKVEIYVNSNAIEGLQVVGSGDIHTLTNLLGQKMEMRIDGSGDITAEVNHRLLVAEINGSGDISLSGSANRLEVSVIGSGDFKGPNMNCQSTNVKLNGSGDALVNAEQYLDATLNGSGDIRYTGFPTDTTFISHGSGTIRSVY